MDFGLGPSKCALTPILNGLDEKSNYEAQCKYYKERLDAFMGWSNL